TSNETPSRTESEGAPSGVSKRFVTLVNFRSNPAVVITQSGLNTRAKHRKFYPHTAEHFDAPARRASTPQPRAAPGQRPGTRRPQQPFALKGQNTYARFLQNSGVNFIFSYPPTLPTIT